ncbi:hypothetical protein POM88_027311 [Heracleum sosnowskyi]|uniref:Uncharacterized protein n=1 Tax=Heracleum sosnowskyi TaxID=360622 RepID=A0AAD8MPR4_9APIA|nr:hypothetical protein POM88_027311 [Heracleum sosnowskyi]
MSSCLDKTSQSNHVSNDYNDPNPEVDFNDETDDDEDLYADEDTLLFIKSLKPVGNSFALVRKSNGDPTFLMYEGLVDAEDCDNESDRRIITRSFTHGSNYVSRNVSSSCGLAKKREKDRNNIGTGNKIVGLNSWSQSVRPRRNKMPRVIKEVCGDGHSGKVDKAVRGLAKKQKIDRGNGAETRKVGSNCLSHNLRPRKYWNPSVEKNVSSHCSDRVIKGREKRSSDYTWRNRRRLANGEHVDKRRARRLSGSRYRRGLVKKRKSNQGNGAEKESSCMMEAEGGQGNGAVKERSNCIMEIQPDQGNGAEKEIICKIEALDDQDYSDSNRAYDIWLRNYIAEMCNLGNGNVETSSDPELEVLDEDPQCIEWKYTGLADSNVLDASVQIYLNLVVDDDLQYIGERSRPENPQFRKDVEGILGRPYDEREYETLWLQVNIRKPMQGYRELRGHLKAYSKDAMGKSYLDEYLDLRGKLDTFETDLPRKLNVLRGFFYYLKNIASDGIFKPWLDESCLAIIPGTE